MHKLYMITRIIFHLKLVSFHLSILICFCLFFKKISGQLLYSFCFVDHRVSSGLSANFQSLGSGLFLRANYRFISSLLLLSPIMVINATYNKVLLTYLVLLLLIIIHLLLGCFGRYADLDDLGTLKNDILPRPSRSMNT